MTRYYILVSGEIAAMARSGDLVAVEGWRLIRPREDLPSPAPYATWWEAEDDEAPAYLEGKPVEVIFQQEGGRVRVMSRTEQDDPQE